MLTMDLHALREELLAAREHVVSGQRIVEAQRALIERLLANGHSVESHKRLLGQFEATLKLLEQHEQLLRQELAERDSAHNKR